MDGQSSFEEAVGAVRLWAERTGPIKRVWFFGSRVRGDSTAGSDLDVALELELVEEGWTVEVTDESGEVLAPVAGLEFWSRKFDVWRREIEALVPWPVHLQWLEPDGRSPTMEAALKDCSWLVFDRGALERATK